LQVLQNIDLFVELFKKTFWFKSHILNIQSFVYKSGMGSRSRVFLAPWSRSRLKKKTGTGAGKKLAGSSDLREDKKHKEIVL